MQAVIEEEDRLRAVLETGLLDTAPEGEFDDLVGLASQICGTPISLFTLADEKRLWFKASVGLDARETPRDIALCDYAIRQRTMLVVEDATQDVRFKANPLVTGAPHLRFYAGVPLEGKGGALLGTLCVIDTVPRVLTLAQIDALTVLAAQVKVRVELRTERLKLREALAEKNRALERLLDSERRFRTFMNNAPFLSFMKDAKGRFIFYNDRMAERFKVTSQEWLGKTDFEIWPQAVAQKLRMHDLEAMNKRGMVERMEATSGPDSEKACWKTYKFPWWNERAEMMLGGFSLDVTEEIARQKELEAANLELKRLATVDTLTGLATRRVLDERLEFEFRYSKRHGSELSVVMIDLDDFKKINDQLGHATGDDVLRHVGTAIRATMRVTDMAARYGGEEFVVLLPGAGTAGAMLFARRLREALRAFDSDSLTVTASLGIAAMDATTTSGNRLIKRADEAMYEAKRRGKNTIVAQRDGMAELRGNSTRKTAGNLSRGPEPADATEKRTDD